MLPAAGRGGSGGTSTKRTIERSKIVSIVKKMHRSFNRLVKSQQGRNNGTRCFDEVKSNIDNILQNLDMLWDDDEDYAPSSSDASKHGSAHPSNPMDGKLQTTVSRICENNL